MTQEFELSKIFKAVTGSLAANQAALNQSDTYNHNHGDHMVEIFKVAQRAVAAKKSTTSAEQLAYASQQVRKKTKSGSATVYADGLANASKKFVGKTVNEQTVGTLIESMMGLEQPDLSTTDRGSGGIQTLLSGLASGQVDTQQPQSSGGLLGSLLSGITGSDQQPQTAPASGGLLGSLLSGMTGAQPQQQPAQTSGDLLSSLLGGATASPASPSSQSGSDLLSTLLSGGESTSSSSSNDMMGSLLSSLTGGSNQNNGHLDMTDLLSTGLAFFMAKQQGSSNLQAIMQALKKNSRFGNSAHRTESGALVVQSILNLLKK